MGEGEKGEEREGKRKLQGIINIIKAPWITAGVVYLSWLSATVKLSGRPRADCQADI